MIYYISDLHLNDQRVFEKCSRPFVNLAELEEEIVNRWNNKVTNSDTVYLLGDISNEGSFFTLEAIKRLNGQKYLIVGNHDLVNLNQIRESKLFLGIEFMMLINDKGRKVCLCHYPLMDWMEFSRGGYHIYGHIHNKTEKQDPSYRQIKDYFKDKLAFNASADVVNFEPVTLDEMIKLKEENINEPYIN